METEIKPVAQPPRRQPFSVCEKMKKVIEHLRDRATVHTCTRQQCRSKGNISGGGTQALEARGARGVWGHAPQKILKSRGLEMLFPAFSKSYL